MSPLVVTERERTRVLGRLWFPWRTLQVFGMLVISTPA